MATETNGGDDNSEESSVYSGLSEDDEDIDEESDIESDSESDIENELKVPDRHDSSDEEDVRNTIGNVPVRWFDDLDHIGYDWEGQKIAKPKRATEIEAFLRRVEDPNFGKSVRDKQTGTEVVLSDEHIAALESISSGGYQVGYNPYEPFLDLYSHEVMEHPLSNRPDDKRSFIPSLIEKKKVSRMVHAIKMGWVKPRKPRIDQDEKTFYDLWELTDEEKEKSKSAINRLRMHIAAPKMPLPGHAESYNPPPEYLFNENELEKWNNAEPEDRKLNFIPESFKSMREIPAYSKFINERFARCLDLYMAPRMRKMKLNVDPNDLLPNLPKPQELQPFPTTLSMTYFGHSDVIRCISIEPFGQFLASGSDDHTIKIWEVTTGRCIKTFQMNAAVNALVWTPNRKFCLLFAAVGNSMFVLNAEVGDKLTVSDSDRLLQVAEKTIAENEGDDNNYCKWEVIKGKSLSDRWKLQISLSQQVKKVVCQKKGDYFATLDSTNTSKCIVVHQLSKCKSQPPFSKIKGVIQQVIFHPTKPYFFVATERHVRMYNLVKQELVKKLQANCQVISSIAIHPRGENLIVGSYDCRVCWFDLELSVKPYKTFRYHKEAIRSVKFHEHYPLFASVSDDGQTIVSHGMVYSDFQNALIVPVKVLRGHKPVDGVNVTDCVFHPDQPWIFTSGADKTIKLYTN